MLESLKLVSSKRSWKNQFQCERLRLRISNIIIHVLDCLLPKNLQNSQLFLNDYFQLKDPKF